MTFADPKNDLTFKKIFGNEKHKDILISFLNSVLDFKDEKAIVDVSIVNPYQVPKIPELKETILDIKATNKNGDTFIVEMQKKDIAYVSQLPKGKNYSILKKVYFIGIVNFNIFENSSYISRHLIINQETNTQDLKDFEFCFIELPKFNKELEELNSILDKWIYFIKNASNLTMVPKEFKDIKVFKEAFDIAMQTAWTPRELEVYEYIALREYDEINALKTAEEKGIKKGIEKGIEQEKIEVVKNSVKLGLDNETISKITGLSIEQIEEIKF